MVMTASPLVHIVRCIPCNLPLQFSGTGRDQGFLSTQADVLKSHVPICSSHCVHPSHSDSRYARTFSTRTGNWRYNLATSWHVAVQTNICFRVLEASPGKKTQTHKVSSSQPCFESCDSATSKEVRICTCTNRVRHIVNTDRRSEQQE